jgi:hypothetical protein
MIDTKPPASFRDPAMTIGLLGCLAVLFAQLAFLHYVDLRVAAMPRLVEPPPIDYTSTSVDTREEIQEAV